MMAFPRIRQRDNLPKNWLVTSFSSKPLLLARADPRSLTWARAPEWKPPKVSSAKGKKTSPSCLQASSVSRFFLRQALASEAPALAAAPATLDLAKGLVTVTSIAASLPSDQRLIITSPGRALVPGSRCLSSLAGPKSALAAVSKITSRSMLCLAILSLVLTQPRA